MKNNKIFSLVFNLFFFLIGSLTVLVVSYRFGWVLLTGPIYWGNDLPFGLSYIFYLDRFWPYLPLWHYEWTGGMPFSQNYPILTTYLTLFIHEISNATIVQVARFLLWFSIPVSGIGIMIFTRLVLKNWLMAILAGVFFVLSPDSWLWIMQAGFYAMTISFPLVVATFVLFELSSQYNKRFFWILTTVFFGLVWLTHPKSATVLTVGLIIYGLIQGLERKKLLFETLRPILISVAGVLLAAFWTIPFILFRGGDVPFSAHQITHLTIKEFLGLAPAQDNVYITSTFFNASLLFLAVLGVLFAFIKRSRVCGKLIAVAFFGIFLLLAPNIFPWMVTKFLLLFWGMIDIRAVILPRLFLPMIAAFGAVSLGQGIFWLITSFRKDLEKSLVWRTLRQVIGGVITIAVVFLVFTYIVIIPPGFKNRFFYQGFGPAYGWPPVHKVGDQWLIIGSDVPIFPTIAESAKRLLSFSIKVDDAKLGEETFLQEAIKKLDLKATDRVDIRSGTIIGSWNTISGVSQTTNYVQNSLIQHWLGYEQGCFYNLGIHCFPQETQNLAKWWGVKLVYIGYGKEEGGALGLEDKAMANLKSAGFKEVIVELDNKGKILTYEVKDSTGLASISNKPLVLAIGGNPADDGGFIALFRSLNRINFSYDRMILIQGKRFIDDYTLDELKSYPLIILYGYRTHDKNKAWEMLSSYVKEGGSLFVDTGWQYFSEDWGKISGGESLEINLPEPLPISKSKWGNIGTKWVYPSMNNWGDLAFEGKPWGMAMAESQDLRQVARALVTDSGKIIIASKTFGKGKVVWSGMNTFFHINYYQSEAENKFILDLFSWLMSEVKNDEKQLSFERINPDHIIIKIDQEISGEKKVMFKEVMAQGWRAFLEFGGVKKELPIQKAGVGWKLVVLPDDFSQGNLILSYGRTLSGWVSIFISILTILGIIIYGLKEDFLAKILNRLIETLKIKTLLNNLSSLKKGWREEEEE